MIFPAPRMVSLRSREVVLTGINARQVSRTAIRLTVFKQREYSGIPKGNPDIWIKFGLLQRGIGFQPG
jgi:hypothetical protein